MLQQLSMTYQLKQAFSVITSTWFSSLSVVAKIQVPQFGIRIVHKKVGSLTNILYLYR